MLFIITNHPDRVKEPIQIRTKEELINVFSAPINHTFVDTGYFYAPYVPMIQTPVVMDPESFSSPRGILTRYGKKLLAEGAQYYGSVVPHYGSVVIPQADRENL